MIADWGVGTIPQMCNRVTNPWDVGIFSKPAIGEIIFYIKNFMIHKKKIYSLKNMYDPEHLPLILTW